MINAGKILDNGTIRIYTIVPRRHSKIMTDHSFNQEKMKRYQALVAPAIAKTHHEAGHSHTDGKYDVFCHTCGLRFVADMFFSKHFGYTIQIHVTGDGQPFTTAVIDEIRDIVYGTHKRFGIGSGKLSDNQRRRKYERAARYLGQIFDELVDAGLFDSTVLQMKAQKAKVKLMATRIILTEIATSNLKGNGES